MRGTRALAFTSGSKKAPTPTSVTSANGGTAGDTTLSWVNPDAALYDGLQVWRSIDGAGYTLVDSPAKGTTSYNDSPGCSIDVAYQVIATRTVGENSNAGQSNTTRTPPGLPTIVSWVASNPGNMVLDASPPASGGAKISRYDVELSTNNGSSWGATTDTGADPDHTFTSVAHGLTCKVRVRTIDTLGQTGAWTTSSGVVSANDTTAPTAGVVSGSFTAGTVNFTLSWTAPSDTESSVVQQVLQVRYSSGSWTDTAVVYNDSASHSSVTHACPDANRGQLVEYRTKAIDTYGNIGYSTGTSIQARPKGSYSLYASSSDTYHASGGAGWYGSGGTTYHGSGDSGNGDGVQTGCWFYGTQVADTCKGFAPDAATIYMKRKGSAGSTGYNNIQPHSNETKPVGAVTLIGVEDPGPYLSGSDDSDSYSLPGSYLTLMGNGTLKGMATTDSGSWRGLYKLTDNANEGLLNLVFY